MYGFLIIIHIIVSILLIIVVLMQQSKGGLGTMFGGGMQDSLFGAGGTASVLTKITVVLAVIFMFTSLTLSVMSKGGGGIKRIESEIPPPAPIPMEQHNEGAPIMPDNDMQLPITPQENNENTGG